MSGRLTVLLAGALMAALMVAMAGMAWAQDGCPIGENCNPGEEPPPPGDTTKPKVTRTVPADEATGFARDKNVKAKFSEAMRARSVNEGTFLVFRGRLSYADLNPPGCPPEDPSCNPTPPPLPIQATVSYNAAKKLAVLNPSRRLAADTTYTAVVEGANDSDGKTVKDKAGNPMARDKVWQFTTAGGGGCTFACE